MRDWHLLGEDPPRFKTSIRRRPSSRPPHGEEPVTLCIVPCWIWIFHPFVFRWSSTCLALFLSVECFLVFFPRSPPRVLRVPRRDPLQTWKIGIEGSTLHNLGIMSHVDHVFGAPTLCFLAWFCCFRAKSKNTLLQFIYFYFTLQVIYLSLSELIFASNEFKGINNPLARVGCKYLLLCV